MSKFLASAVLAVAIFLIVFSGSTFGTSVPTPTFPVAAPNLTAYGSGFGLLTSLSVSVLTAPTRCGLFFGGLHAL